MLQTRLIVAAAALLLTGGVVSAADDGKTPAEQLDAAVKKITALQNDLAALKSKVDRIESTQRSWIDTMEVRQQLQDLQAEMIRLRDEVRASEKRSTSGYAPMPKNDDSRIPPTRTETYRMATATVRLRNDFPFTQEVLVNGAPYILAPGDDVRVPVAAGTFSLQVMSRDAVPRSVTVPAGYVHTLWLH